MTGRHESTAHPPIRTSSAGRRFDVRGTVQGVGFRPWVFRLASEEGLAGRVFNHSHGVTIEAFGPPQTLGRFEERLRHEAPPAARIESVDASEIPFEEIGAFLIVESRTDAERRVSIPPDLATCDDCLREVFDPADRRHLYPFTNCTNCGPRFTIVRDVPYDRPATTMAGFPMCPACQAEYDDPANRRFHAQPNACPRCGPRLAVLSPEGATVVSPDPLDDVARALREGGIVAVKGIGGFHLACDATSGSAVRELRRRKHRDAKPFAVMVRDLATADSLAALDDHERRLLTSVERPITLVERRPGAPLALDIAPGNPLVGLMLPYSPLHHLLLAKVERPLVMTSGNLSDEPLAIDNAEAVSRRVGPVSGKRRCRVSGGVRKAQVSAFGSVPPVAERVPDGTVARNSVAMGKRPTGSKSSVLLPTQRQLPWTGGVSCTGCTLAASSCDVTATIGWEKVRLRWGASGTSPRGSLRSTSRGPAATVSGAAASPLGGNGSLTVAPVRGAGSELSLSAKSCSSSGATSSAGNRSRTWRVSASLRRSAAAGLMRS